MKREQIEDGDFGGIRWQSVAEEEISQGGCGQTPTESGERGEEIVKEIGNGNWEMGKG